MKMNSKKISYVAMFLFIAGCMYVYTFYDSQQNNIELVSSDFVIKNYNYRETPFKDDIDPKYENLIEFCNSDFIKNTKKLQGIDEKDTLSLDDIRTNDNYMFMVFSIGSISDLYMVYLYDIKIEKFIYKFYYSPLSYPE